MGNKPSRHIATQVLTRRNFLRLFALAAAAGTLSALPGCSDVGEYDAREIAAAAERYYNKKYGSDASVTDISEETTSGLFGTSSLKNFFCTMSDGFVVYYHQGANSTNDLFKDNRQAAEVLPLYISYLREFEQKAAQRFIDAGYEASFCIDDWHDLSSDQIAKNIAYETWESSEQDFSGSYFHTKLEEQGSSYLYEEKPYSTLSIFGLYAYLGGPDADYANAFPTNVPETPAWQAAADAIADDFTQISESFTVLEIHQASTGKMENDEVKLGKRYTSGYGGAWAIYNYVDCGNGIWAAPNERGLRLSSSDFILTETTDTFTLDDLAEGVSNLSDYNTSAYRSYTLKLSESAVARAEQALEEFGSHDAPWISLLFAFDSASVLRANGTSYENPVRLYSIEDATSTRASDDEEDSGYDLSIITYSKEPLPNGMLSGSEALYLDDGLCIACM